MRASRAIRSRAHSGRTFMAFGRDTFRENLHLITFNLIPVACIHANSCWSHSCIFWHIRPWMRPDGPRLNELLGVCCRWWMWSVIHLACSCIHVYSSSVTFISIRQCYIRSHSKPFTWHVASPHIRLAWSILRRLYSYSFNRMQNILADTCRFARILFVAHSDT